MTWDAPDGRGTCTYYGARPMLYRVPLTSTEVDHTFQIELRFRVDGLPAGLDGEAGVHATIGRVVRDSDGTTDYFQFLEPSNRVSRSGLFRPAEARPIRPGVWEQVTVEFAAESGSKVTEFYLAVQPRVAMFGAGRCGLSPTVSVDDVSARFLVFFDEEPSRILPDVGNLGIGEEGAAELLNGYRELAGLSPLPYDFAASAGARDHARYAVLNRLTGIGHFEEPGRPGYTPAGDAAARTANVCPADASAASCARVLLSIPYHRLSLLSATSSATARALQIGWAGGWPPLVIFGVSIPRGVGVLGFLDHDLSSGLAADAYREELERYRAGPPQPLIWPADGVGRVPTRVALHERPDPLALCPSAPADRTVGYPITVQFPWTNAERPVVFDAARLIDDSAADVPLCVIDAQRPSATDHGLYAPGDSVSISLPGALIAIPLAPLYRSTRYTFSVSASVEGHSGTWTSAFVTEGLAPPLIPSLVPEPPLAHLWRGTIPAAGAALLAFEGGTIEEASVGMEGLYVLEGGRWFSYLPGAPGAVNAMFAAHFPGGDLPAGQVLFVRIKSDR